MTGAAIASAATGAVSLGKSFGDSKRAGEAGDRAVSAAERNIGVANDLNKLLTQLGADGVEVAQGLMDDWEGTFGGIQDKLATYYQELAPTQYSAQAKADYALNLDKQMKQYNETMAGQGLQTAGMKQQTAKEAAFKQAEVNTGIDLAADDKVAALQQGFVNSGEGQRNQATNFLNTALGRQGQYATTGANAILNANTGVANAYTGQAQAYGQSGAGFAGAAGNLFGSAIGLGINSGGAKTPGWKNGFAGSGQEGISGPRRPSGVL